MNPLFLANKIRTAPKKSGVYTFKDARGRLLYVGKAKDLRSRLLSYPKTKDTRIAAMVAEARSVEWEITPTEIEALIVESRRIKSRRPKYNVLMRDDKRYLLVALTDEPFPKFIPTHQVASRALRKPVREYLGPFTESAPVYTTLKLLRGLFPTCSCKQTHYVRCLNAHLGLCQGYCCLKSPASAPQKREYARNVRAVLGILSGERESVILRIERDMKRLAAAGHLEDARALQEKIRRVRTVFEHAQAHERRRSAGGRTVAAGVIAKTLGLHNEPHRIEGYDIAMIQGQHASGAMVVFEEGKPVSAEYRLFNVAGGITGDVPMLRHVLERRFAHDEWPLPDVIVVDGGKAQLNAAMKSVASFQLSVPVLAVRKNDRHQPDYLLSSVSSAAVPLASLPAPLRNLLARIDAEAHRFVIAHYRRRHRRSLRG